MEDFLRLQSDSYYAAFLKSDLHVNMELKLSFALASIGTRGHIFSHVRPFYERAVSNLDRSMDKSLWV